MGCYPSDRPDEGTLERVRNLAPGPVGRSAMPMTMRARLSIIMRYAVEMLPGDLREQGEVLLTPWAIASMAAMFGISVGAQFTPFGWLADLAMFGLGAAAVGTAAIQVMTDLRAFAHGALSADTDDDLRASAGHLARAITVIGVGTLLLWLAKRSARVFLSTSETLSAARSVVLDLGDREIAFWSGVKPEQIPRQYATLERLLGDTPAGRVLLEILERGGFEKFESVWYELSDRIGALAAKSGKPAHYFVSAERGFYEALNPTNLMEWWLGHRAELAQTIRARLTADGASPAEIEQKVAALSRWTRDDIEAQYYAVKRGVIRPRPTGQRHYFEDEVFHKIEKLGLRGAWVHELDSNGVEICKWWQTF